MDQSEILDLLQQTVRMCGTILTPFLVTSFLIGCIMSLFQTMMQLQDQGITAIPKLIGLGILLLVLVPWIFEHLTNFATMVIQESPTVLGG